MQDLQAYLQHIFHEAAGIPALVYDMHRVEKRVQALQQLASAYHTRFLFAVKAFPDPEIIRFFHRHHLGFDISNPSEMELVKSAIQGEHAAVLSITGPALYASPGFATEALSFCREVIVNTESPEQFRELVNSIPGAAAGYRISAHKNGLGNIYQDKMATRFGLSGIADLVQNLPADEVSHISGLHVHTGEKITDPLCYLQQVNEIMTLVETHHLPLRYINLGGGIKGFSPEVFGVLLQEIRNMVPHAIQVLFEPGDYWFEDAGFAVGKIYRSSLFQDLLTMVQTNLSKDCHLKWSEPSLYRIDDTDMDDRPLLLTGPTCHEGDVIGIFMPETSGKNRQNQIAEKAVIFSGISPYSAAWNCAFNGIPRAKVYKYGI